MPFENASASSKTVLIVDDDPVFAAMLSQVLAARGVSRVLTAADGNEAERMLAEKSGEIDAMTLDLSMPNQDGVTFLRSARAAGYAGRLLLISGEHASVVASAARLAKLLGLNCVGAMAKPVDYLAVADLAVADTVAAPCASRPAIDGEAVDAMLRDARIVAHFQPKIDLRTGRLVGAETLARMTDADGRPLNVEEVIAQAEATGRIDAVTWRIIDGMIAAARRLAAQGLTLRMSANITASNLEDRRFPDELAARVREAKLDPGKIVLELTESGIPDDLSFALEGLTRLRMLGFQLSIDDFGTGASNIERLQHHPFTELKIDKGFVLRSATDSFSRACVESSVLLARELSLVVVAEGVETQRELDIVRRAGADIGQGYLFARAMAFEDFLQYALACRERPVIALAPDRAVA